MTQPTNPTKEIVTVAEMARNIGLSRARFYELIGEGVFPSPSRNPETKRPFFDRQQQEQCLLIRKTNQGANGRAVLFYGRRLEIAPLPRRAASKKKKPARPRDNDTVGARSDALIDELRQGLRQLGLAEITPAVVREALVDVYPDGHGQVDRSELLLTVFRCLKRRDSPDNVAR